MTSSQTPTDSRRRKFAKAKIAINALGLGPVAKWWSTLKAWIMTYVKDREFIYEPYVWYKSIPTWFGIAAAPFIAAATWFPFLKGHWFISVLTIVAVLTAATVIRRRRKQAGSNNPLLSKVFRYPGRRYEMFKNRRQHSTPPAGSGRSRWIPSRPTSSTVKASTALAAMALVSLILIVVFYNNGWKWGLATAGIIAATIAIAAAVTYVWRKKQASGNSWKFWQRVKLARFGNRKGWIVTSIVTGAVIIALLGGLVGSLATDDDTSTLNASSSTSEDNSANEKLIADAEARATEAATKAAEAETKATEAEARAAAAEAKAAEAEARATAAAAGTVRTVSNTHDLTDSEQKILDNWVAKGGSPTDLAFGPDISVELAKAIDAGGSVFGAAVYSPSDAARFMSENTPEAKAAVTQWQTVNQSCSIKDARDANQWTAVQSLVPTKFGANTYYLDNQVVDGGTKIDEAGTIAVFFTGDCVNELDPSKWFSLRGACANPQLDIWEPAAPQGGVIYTWKHTPTGPTPIIPPIGGCDQPNGCVPIIPPIGGCDQPNGCVPVTPPCVDQPGKPCEENPPCVGDHCNPPCVGDHCNPPCVDQPGKPCDNPPCVDQPDKPCKPLPEKCEGVSNDQDCSNWDQEGPNQPEDANDPALTAPTEGAPPRGETEAVIDQQNSETPGGTDPTQHGTPADGDLPGSVHQTPGDDAQDNPDSDGTPADAGTNAGTDNDAGSEEAQTDASGDTSGAGDPLPDMNLPNVEHVEVSNDQNYVAPAADSNVTVASAPVASDQSAYTSAPAETYDTSTYDAPAAAPAAPAADYSASTAPVVVDSPAVSVDTASTSVATAADTALPAS